MKVCLLFFLTLRGLTEQMISGKLFIKSTNQRIGEIKLVRLIPLYLHNYRCLEIIRCKTSFEGNNKYDFIELFFGITILMNSYLGFYIKMVTKNKKQNKQT